jgi:alkanesulfonate monooxygenase SsuD/methylene tetrahydromethanopterin reductase-like flavin-dependent oxidoreductase (luciferase family)
MAATDVPLSVLDLSPIPSVASSAPMVMIASVAAATSRVPGYCERFEPSSRMSEPRVMRGVAAIVSETQERAVALAHDLATLRRMQNRHGPVPTPRTPTS